MCIWNFFLLIQLFHRYDTWALNIYVHFVHICFLQNYAFKVAELQRTIKSITFIHSYICPFNQLPKQKQLLKTHSLDDSNALIHSFSLHSSRIQLNFIGFRKHSPNSKDQFIIIQCVIWLFIKLHSWYVRMCECSLLSAQCVIVIIIHLPNLKSNLNNGLKYAAEIYHQLGECVLRYSGVILWMWD